MVRDSCDSELILQDDKDFMKTFLQNMYNNGKLYSESHIITQFINMKE
jgi:hypothetical protein